MSDTLQFYGAKAIIQPSRSLHDQQHKHYTSNITMRGANTTVLRIQSVSHGFVPQEWLADAHRAAVSLHEKGYKTAAMELYRLCIDELEKAHGAAPRHQEVFVDERAIRVTADQST